MRDPAQELFDLPHRLILDASVRDGELDGFPADSDEGSTVQLRDEIGHIPSDDVHEPRLFGFGLGVGGARDDRGLRLLYVPAPLLRETPHECPRILDDLLVECLGKILSITPYR